MNINIKDTDTEKYTEFVKRLNEGKEPKAYVLTFGCQQNEADSEKIRGMALDMGYVLTDRAEDADFIAVNTCAIREHAEMKALSLIGNFKALKKKNPELIIGICGCMAAEKHRADMIKTDFHYVTFTVEPNMIRKIPELIYRYSVDRKRSFVYNSDDGSAVEGFRNNRKSNFSAWVSVMYGCNNFCTYCIVPYVRGRERSRDSKSIIDECENLVRTGYKEITLLGQNVNSYRSDVDFSGLIEKIAQIDGDFVIRFMTSHPKDVSDNLIRVMKEYKGKIAPVFHLPLQSGSDSVLKRMNRTYNTATFLDTVRKLRESIPEISLTSDIIVGFPGESDEDFENTLSMLRDIRFDMVYAFIYSKRVGTAAASFDDHIPEEIKNARISELLKIQDDISYEKNLPYVGRFERILVDSVSKRGDGEAYTGRTLSNKLVHFNSKVNCVGEFKNIKITSAGVYDLYGEEIKETEGFKI